MTKVDPNLRREIILEHYQNPKNRGLVQEDGYLRENTYNDSCIDNLDIMMKIEDDVIKDIRFDGEACAISTSATSIMIETLLEKTVDEAKEIIHNYENMIEEKDYQKEILGELIVYNETYKQPNRKKCALLPFESVKKILEKQEKRK